MKEFYVIETPTVIAETTSMFGLKLLPGAALLPPEEKLLTMTVNGVQVNPVAGTYEGNIVSVSYTHLDVYKRQVCFFAESNPDCPVFYPTQPDSGVSDRGTRRLCDHCG